MTSNKVNWSDMDLDSNIFWHSVYPSAACSINRLAKILKLQTSEKFNKEVGSLLSEKVCDSLLTWKVNSIRVDNPDQSSPSAKVMNISTNSHMLWWKKYTGSVKSTPCNLRTWPWKLSTFLDSMSNAWQYYKVVIHELNLFMTSRSCIFVFFLQYKNCICH